MNVSLRGLIIFSMYQKGTFTKLKYTFFGILFYSKLRKDISEKNKENENGITSFSDDVYPLF